MIGTLLNQRYRLDAELGRGGMGAVYRAHDSVLAREVAVKVLFTTQLDTEARTRLLNEARAAARLNHPNIVAIYDASEVGETPYIVMELITGESLHSCCEKILPEILAVGQQICTALEHAHQHGIIHRDLKPENVMIAPDGTAKLMDFGLARSVTSRLSSEDTVVGTVFYLAPEQALGQEIDGRTDLYALGVMLYELTTGKLPFTGDGPLAVISQHLHAPVVPPSTYNSAIPPALDSLILMLLNKHPDDRPSSAAQVQELLAQLEAPADQVPAAERTTRIKSPPLLNRLVRGRLVGRESEFTEAKALWQQAAAGIQAGQVLLVSGEPGIGKTRFVRELVTLAEVSGGASLQSNCYAETTAPYAPIAQMIRQAFANPKLTGDNFHLPGIVLADLLTLVPELSARYPDVEPNSPLAPQAEQQRLFDSLAAFCTELATRAPLLLLVEDVHWVDCCTLPLLHYLARRSRMQGPQLPLLIVLTYREVDLSQDHPFNEMQLHLNRERASTRIKLVRLDRDQTNSMISLMFAEQASADLVDNIYRETEGNPFFIEEVCKALVESGKLYRDNGRWKRIPTEEIEIPQSVRLAIQSRVAQLPEEAQAILRLASIIGREFDFEVLRRACELGEEALITALETAERAQLISELRQPGREIFAFAHALTPTTLRDGVSGLRRHRMHRQIAAAIEASRPDDLEALAYHYGEAGEEECARKYIVKAAERARKVYANDEAVRLYSEALSLLPEASAERFDLLAARAEIYDLIAKRDKQRQDVEAMLKLAKKLKDEERHCDALLASAELYQNTDPLQAKEPIEKAIKLAKALNDPAREARALCNLGDHARNNHDAAGSREALEAAATLFKKVDLLGEAAAALHTLSLALGDLGENESALKVGEKALALSQKAGDKRQEATSLRRVAIAYINTEEYEKALPYAEKALALHRKLGDRSEECHALNVMGLITGWLGQTTKAEAFFLEAIKLAEAINATMGYSNALANLLEIHFRWHGRYEAGLMFVEEKLQEAQVSDNQFLINNVLMAKAVMLIHLGQFEAALELIQNQRSLAGISSQVAPAKVDTYLSMVWAELGQYQAAREHLSKVQPTIRPSDIKATADFLLREAYVDWMEGGEDCLQQGLARASRALELLESKEWLDHQAELHHMLARFYLVLDRTSAEEALKHSSLAVHLTAKWPFIMEAHFFSHSQALRAAGQELEANDYLDRAYQRVKQVADSCHNPILRQGWLENIRTNREIVAEWGRYLGNQRA